MVASHAYADDGDFCDPEAAVDLCAHPADKCIMLVALAQRNGDAKLLALAEKLNYMPGLIRTVLRRAIEKLKADQR